MRFELPGGGGYGDPFGRDVASVLADVVDGYVSIGRGTGPSTASRSSTSVLPIGSCACRTPYRVDLDETERLRGGTWSCSGDKPVNAHETIGCVNEDHVDHLVAQWQRERPDLDVSPMEVIARISRLCRILERRIEDGYAAEGLNQSQFGVLAALLPQGRPTAYRRPVSTSRC